MKLQAILFDIDGTLVDSNDLHCDCWLEAFEHFGKPIDRDVMRHQIGKGGDLLVPDLLSAKEMQQFGEELGKFRSDLFKKKYIDRVRPFDGIAEHVREVHARGVKIALASSANPEEVEHFVELIGIGDILEDTTSKGDANISKPSPEIFDAALEKVGTKRERTLVVGDTPYDILASHRAAMAVAAVLCGGFERELLAKAEFIFDNVAELVRRIEEVDEYFAR